MSTGIKLQQETMKTLKLHAASQREESDQAAILVMKRMLVINCDMRMTLIWKHVRLKFCSTIL
jgi:hypothetical protein